MPFKDWSRSVQVGRGLQSSLLEAALACRPHCSPALLLKDWSAGMKIINVTGILWMLMSALCFFIMMLVGLIAEAVKI